MGGYSYCSIDLPLVVQSKGRSRKSKSVFVGLFSETKGSCGVDGFFFFFSLIFAFHAKSLFIWVSFPYWISVIGRALGISVVGGLCKIIWRHTSRLWGTKYSFKEIRYYSGSCESGRAVLWEPRLSHYASSWIRPLPTTWATCAEDFMWVLIWKMEVIKTLASRSLWKGSKVHLTKNMTWTRPLVFKSQLYCL